jgi:eukaryotic-like serine/threonine-protein kinase
MCVVPTARSRIRAILLLALAAQAACLTDRRSAERSDPESRRLTFRRGFVREARFGPNEASTVYSASWEGQPPRVYLVDASHPRGRLLDLPEADLLAVSKKGDLAILLRPPLLAASTGSFATLARSRIDGGEPKQVVTSVSDADWGPDGESLAVVRLIENRTRRLEFPVGNVLYETAPADCIGSPRVAPDGQRVAFVACKEDQPAIVVVDRERKVERPMRSLRYIGALAWSPRGDELWYSVGAAGLHPELRAVTLGGKERVLARVPGTIEDVARDGRVLVSRGASIWGVRGVAPGENQERELSWLEGSAAVDLSKDGRLVLFGEALEGGGVNGRIDVRATDGSPGVHLADGFPACLSPDGRWALVKQPGLTDFTVLPTGTGESRQLQAPEFHPYLARWFPDGQRILWGAELPGRPGRLWLQDLAGGPPQPLTPERTGVGVISPDGGSIATIGDDGHFVYPTDGGPRRPLRGPLPDEWPIQWGDDGRLYAARQDELPARVMRIDVATGKRELWRELAPPDRSGIIGLRPLITRDARAYVYTYNRLLSELFEVSGVR